VGWGIHGLNSDAGEEHKKNKAGIMLHDEYFCKDKWKMQYPLARKNASSQ
jgi:hypothetical protein